MSNLIPLILGMAAVTYLPRLLPFFIVTDKKIPKSLEAFLDCIPAASLGALVVPGMFSVTPDVPLAAVLGIGFTIVYGLIRGGILLPVLGSVAVTYFVLLHFH
ncbi:MAG: AzlD domain-containing protein [Thermodesulfobacteriota bacterium]|nr:AzlD domain-containing protein [Thermodesulfobacteriota bacterium]